MSVATPRSTSDDASDDGSITPTISSSPRAHEDFPPVVGRGSSSPDLRRRVGSAAFRAESAAAAASGRRPSHLKMERVPSENSVMSNESDQSSEPLTQSSFEFLAYIHEKLKSGNHDPLLWLETQAREHFFSWACVMFTCEWFGPGRHHWVGGDARARSVHHACVRELRTQVRMHC